MWNHWRLRGLRQGLWCWARARVAQEQERQRRPPHPQPGETRDRGRPPQPAATPPGVSDEPPAAPSHLAPAQQLQQAAPPHAHWLASIPDLWRSGWYQSVFAPAGPPHDWLDTACGWHHPTYPSGNTRHLSLVVVGCGTILTHESLQCMLTSFEVRLFRSGRGQFYLLADQLRLAFHRGMLAIQRSRRTCRHTFFSCRRCGNYFAFDFIGFW